MTRKNKKYLLIAVGVLVLMVVAFAVLIKVLITPERIKMALIPRAEQAIGRPLEIGEIEISLFSGILLKDLVIREKAGDAVFIAADTVALDYQFWPLLQKRLVVDEILLDQPKIRIERLPDGSFNFSDLQDRIDESSDSETPEKEHEQREVDLLISTIILRGGEVSLVDHQVTAGEPFHYQLTNVALQVDDLSLENEFPLRLEALLGEAPLALSGRINPNLKTMQANLSLAGFDVMPFNPYFRGKLPGQLRSMLVDLQLTLAGNEQLLSSEGGISLSNIDLQFQALPDAPLKNANLNFEYALQLDQPAATVDISRGRLVFNGLPVMITGKITDYTTKPMLDLVLSLSELPVQNILVASAGMSPSLAELNPTGKLSARLNLAGSIDEPKALLQSGEIHLAEVQAKAGGQRPALTGQVALQRNKLSAKGLTLLLGPNRALLDLEVNDFLARPMVITSALTSERFHIDPLLGTEVPKGPTESPKTGAAKPTSSESKEVGPLDLPIKMKGTARIGQVLYKNLIIDQLKARYHLEDNILVLDEMTGKVAGGTFSETARVDLGKKGLEYTARLNTKGVQINPLVSAFLPKAAETVFGGLDLQLGLSGKGTQLATIQKTLTVQGDILLKDGKLTGAGLVTELANFLALDELRVLNFQQAKGSFAVKNGRIDLDSSLSGKTLQLAPKGSVGLDGGLDLDLGLRLSPPLVSKLGRKDITALLTDAEGWGRIPLNVAGTFQKPRFALDSGAVKTLAEEKAKGALRKTLQEKVFEKKKPASEGEKEPTDTNPAEKLLEGVFKGLFGN